MRDAAPHSAGLPMKIRAPHKGKFLLDVIEQQSPCFRHFTATFQPA